MTWEWVVLIGILSLCGTASWFSRIKIDPEVERIATLLRSIESRLCFVESFVNVAEDSITESQTLAKETKKLISEANLVKGLRPLR